MNTLSLVIYPKNKSKFNRLQIFLEDVLKVADDLELKPILDGSLAVLVYTKKSDLVVNDIDFSLPEKEFPKFKEALEETGHKAEIKEWHVLQVRKDDLKIEFSDVNFWYSNIGVPIEYDFLEIDDFEIRILKLKTLKAFYKRGLDNTKGDPEKRAKYTDIKKKYEELINIRCL